MAASGTRKAGSNPNRSTWPSCRQDGVFLKKKLTKRTCEIVPNDRVPVTKMLAAKCKRLVEMDRAFAPA